MKGTSDKCSQKRLKLRTKRFRHSKVRQNINFLDKPIWLPIHGRSKIHTIDEYEDGSGFILESGSKGFPDHQDMKWLYYMMYRLQEQYYEKEDFYILEFTSFYEILHDLGMPTNPEYYKRFRLSLDRWSDVKLHFNNNTFYKSAENEKTRNRKISTTFSVIIGTTISVLGEESAIEKKSGWPEDLKKLDFLKIRFDPDFLRANLEKYSRDIPFLPILIMPPLANRLYEILCKSFYRKLTYSISYEKLKGKIGRLFQDKSHLVREVNKALEELSDKALLHIEFKMDKNICVFTKIL